MATSSSGSRQRRTASRRHRLLIVVIAILALTPVAVLTVLAGWGNDTSIRRELRIEVDPDLPGPEQADGYNDGDAPHPVGQIENTDGSGVSSIVLDHVIVLAEDPQQLEAFLARRNGTVIDSSGELGGGRQVHVVRIPPPPPADPRSVAMALAAQEPIEGVMRVDSDATLAFLGVLADEMARGEVTVTADTLVESDGIPDGSLVEFAEHGNVFDWPYISSTSTQAIGLDAAWQLLEWQGKLTPQFTALVSDGGFLRHVDLPSYTLRHADWEDHGRLSCGENRCPFHGTGVALAIAGLHDNGTGTAGAATPVVNKLVAVANFTSTLKTLMRLEEMVEEYRPAVVNMSWSGPTPDGLKMTTEAVHDAYFEDMVRHGALLVASAPNENMNVDADETFLWQGFPTRSPLIYPCESRFVLCVGGLDTDSTARRTANGFYSAYGDRNDRKSVELYGPYCLRSVENVIATTQVPGQFCGNSAAAPFVAGVALLIKAADPTLGPDQIRTLLVETAHRGVTNIPSPAINFGQYRWVNAGEAVIAALGVPVGAPTVQIINPINNDQSAPQVSLLLRAEATNFAGQALPVRWQSDRDGPLFGASASKDARYALLSTGIHVLTASATDERGRTSSATVTVRILPPSPTVTITTPADQTSRPAGSALALQGTSALQSFPYGPLADTSVRWTVLRKGEAVPVFSGSGHNVTVPAVAMKPGEYKILLDGDPGSGGAKGHDEATVTVTEVLPGQEPPLPSIALPDPNAEFVALPNESEGAHVRLQGSAHDPQDGPVPGSALQWVAQAGSQRLVLCTGSSFPSNGGSVEGSTGSDGVLGALQDCSDVTVRIPPPASVPFSSAWSIELRAVDGQGHISAPVARQITVTFPPVG